MKIALRRLAPRLNWTALGRSILREAAVAPAAVAVALSLIGAFWIPLTPDLQSLIDACAAAVAGVVTALLVRDDRLLPALVALINAGFQLSLGLGLQVTADRQATVMAAVTGLAAAWLRTQLYAKVGPPIPPFDTNGPVFAVDPAGTQFTPAVVGPATPDYHTVTFPAVTDNAVETTQSVAAVRSGRRSPDYLNR